MVRLRGAVCALAVIALLAWPRCGVSSGEHRSDSPTAAIGADAGVKILAALGVKDPSDIESAVIDLMPTVKLTRKDDPELITELYNGMRAIYRTGTTTVIGQKLILTLRNGKTFVFGFRQADEHYDERYPTYVYLTMNYCSLELAVVFGKARRIEAALSRDSRVGDLKVAEVEVQRAGGGRVRADPSSAIGHNIVREATALVDWFDLRKAMARVVAPEEMDKAGREFGMVLLSLATPVDVDISVDDGSVQIGAFPDPYWTNVSFRRITCDAAVVTDYGHPRQIRVALREKSTGRYYLSSGYLWRRDNEAFGVHTYGWAGHPLSDVEYYKKPEKVYRELMEIVRAVSKRRGM